MNNIPSFVQLAQLKQQRTEEKRAAREDNANKSNDKCNVEILSMARLGVSYCFCNVLTTEAYRDALSAKGYDVQEQRVPIYNADGDSTGETEIANYKVRW